MKELFVAFIAVLMAVTLASCATTETTGATAGSELSKSQAPSQPPKPGVVAVEVTEWTATVKAVDYAKKTVVLERDGKTATVDASYAKRLNEIKPGVFFDADDFSVTAFPVMHRGPDCFGYLFEEKARRPFLPERADALGVPFGPERRDLVEGKPIRLADGREVTPEDVLGPTQRGTKFVVIGDTGRTDDLVEVCRDADGLVIESTYLEQESEMARQFSHLTARQAGQLATQAGVHKLILTHISRRYREKDVLAEAQSAFPNAVVARDFDTFQFKREG